MDNRKIRDIARKISFLRSHDAVSLRELAGELRLHRDRIFHLETGEYKADLQDVIRYCERFSLDYEGFLFDSFADFEASYLADERKLMKAIGYK